MQNQNGGWRTFVCRRESEVKGSGAVECFLKDHTEEKKHPDLSAVAKADISWPEQR
jgi:hypothetical protein